jgi:hypothetical protein
MPHMFPINEKREHFIDGKSKSKDPGSYYISYRMVILYGIFAELNKKLPESPEEREQSKTRLQIDLDEMKRYLEAVETMPHKSPDFYNGALFDLYKINSDLVVLNDKHDCSYPLILHYREQDKQEPRKRLHAFFKSVSDISDNFSDYLEIIDAYPGIKNLTDSDILCESLIHKMDDNQKRITNKR